MTKLVYHSLAYRFVVDTLKEGKPVSESDVNTKISSSPNHVRIARRTIERVKRVFGDDAVLLLVDGSYTLTPLSKPRQ